jgi:hypothetical protein
MAKVTISSFAANTEMPLTDNSWLARLFVARRIRGSNRGVCES